MSSPIPSESSLSTTSTTDAKPRARVSAGKRILYSRFTKAKDLSLYSEEDLKSILGPNARKVMKEEELKEEKVVVIKQGPLDDADVKTQDEHKVYCEVGGFPWRS